LSADLSRAIVEAFLKDSWSCIEALVNELAAFKETLKPSVPLFYYKDGRRNNVALDSKHFFLRTSVEYSTPQLTIEELQGIVAARLLEVCGNYFYKYRSHEFDTKDVEEICETLRKPPQGFIFPFSLNTDDIEPDRYSANPFRESIVTSGQSAFPCAKVRTDMFTIDPKFMQKYEGVLVCREDIERIRNHLGTSGNSYTDLVDAVKYEQLQDLSDSFGIDLCVHSMRMPLTILEKETVDGTLHQMISETHRDYQSIEFVYNCMGRSMKNLTTLITVPHSPKGFASKRAVRGRIYFEGTKLKNVKVKYQTVLLYENDVDPSDASVARADDSFTVEGEKLGNYSFKDTPSSPQFFLYSLMSPENAALWHGIGEFGAAELLKSYATTRVACSIDSVFKNLSQKHGLNAQMPLQFNLMPKHMWRHPTHHNIDASVSCIRSLKDLVNFDMKVEHLRADQFVRERTNQGKSYA